MIVDVVAVVTAAVVEVVVSVCVCVQQIFSIIASPSSSRMGRGVGDGHAA